MLLYLHIFYIVLCIFVTLNFRISLKMSLLKWLVDIIFSHPAEKGAVHSRIKIFVSKHSE